jgi:hypothetical protein
MTCQQQISRAAAAPLLAVALAACSSTSHQPVRSTASGGATSAERSASPTAKAAVTGRAYTTQCVPRIAGRCPVTPYRGSLVFCVAMNQIGPCPGATVDADGRFALRLRPGRYALLPAPGSRNVVSIKPRWVSVAAPRTALRITGDNIAD